MRITSTPKKTWLLVFVTPMKTIFSKTLKCFIFLSVCWLFILIDYCAGSTSIDGAQYTGSRVNTTLAQYTNLSNWTTFSVQTALDATPFTNIQFSSVPPCTDMAPPTITCPPTQTRNPGDICDLPVEDFTGLATISDDCGSVTVTQSLSTTATLFGYGEVPVTLTATDGAGKTATCSFILDLVDNTVPNIDCPSTQNRTVDANCQYSLEDFTGDATATDNCHNTSISQSPPPGTTLGVGNQVVTLTVMDLFENTSTCTFTVTVEENILPTITCSPDLTIEWGDQENPPATGIPTVTDNCDSNPTITFTDNVIITGNCPIARIIERTYTATDVGGNPASCLQIINVSDTTPPTINCPPSLTFEWTPNFNLNPVPPNVPQDPSVAP